MAAESVDLQYIAFWKPVFGAPEAEALFCAVSGYSVLAAAFMDAF